jgi:hypothetical protein
MGTEEILTWVLVAIYNIKSSHNLLMGTIFIC